MRTPARACQMAIVGSPPEQLHDLLADLQINDQAKYVDDGADERFLMALRHVAKAHGMTAVAEKSGMARQAMYRALSETGNPELSTLKALLDAMGLKLAVEQKPRAS